MTGATAKPTTWMTARSWIGDHESVEKIRRLTQMNADSKTRDPETFAIIGAAMEVHRELRHGFLEAVYQDAMAVEFALQQIPFEREKPLRVFYKAGILPS